MRLIVCYSIREPEAPHHWPGSLASHDHYHRRSIAGTANASADRSPVGHRIQTAASPQTAS